MELSAWNGYPVNTQVPGCYPHCKSGNLMWSGRWSPLI